MKRSQMWETQENQLRERACLSQKTPWHYSIDQKHKTLHVALTGGCSESDLHTMKRWYLSSLILNKNTERNLLITSWNIYLRQKKAYLFPLTSAISKRFSFGNEMIRSLPWTPLFSVELWKPKEFWNYLVRTILLM